jgi:hypothetical protein
MQLDKAECARQRKNLKAKMKPETTTQSATQTYKTGTAKPAQLSKKQ